MVISVEDEVQETKWTFNPELEWDISQNKSNIPANAMDVVAHTTQLLLYYWTIFLSVNFLNIFIHNHNQMTTLV